MSNGITFDVITLPKGTVLFHGFYANFNGSISEDKLVSELFGDHDDSGDYCVSQTTQKFFYPAPFMGDIVYKFQLYAIFILNYDVNLVSKVLPSKEIHKEKGDLSGPTIRCDSLRKKDVCGMDMKWADHCLTPQLLKEHPDIHGYMAIPNNDGSRFKGMFYSHLSKTHPDYVSMTTPMTVSNSKGLTAIPEIVLHPYHVRLEEPRLVPSKVVYDPINFILQYQSLLNFFPLMYFSETGSFSLLDLDTKAARNKYLSTLRSDDGAAISPIHVRIKTFLDNALSPAGVKIHDMIFRISVDKRTGFYIAHYDRIYVDVPKETSMLKIFTEAPENTIIPFEYPAYLKKRLHGVLASERKYPTSVEILSNNLSKHKASFRNKYIFDKHNSSRKFEYEKSFPHPNRLNIHNKTRKLSKLHNHKHSKTVKSKIRLNNRLANF
jgi:hypothetical protein